MKEFQHEVTTWINGFGKVVYACERNHRGLEQQQTTTGWMVQESTPFFFLSALVLNLKRGISFLSLD